MNIGLFVDYYFNISSMQIIEYLEQACEKFGHQLYIFEGRSINDVEPMIRPYNSIYHILSEKRIDGLILIASSLVDTDNIQKMDAYLKSIHIPVVTIGRKIGDFPYVHSDNESGIRKVFGHLYGHGKRKIAFVTGLMEQKDAIERYETYKSLLQENNLAYNPGFVYEGAFSKRSGRDAALHFAPFIKNNEIDTIIFSNDDMASGALTAFQALGICCPEDVLLTGYDNVSWSALTDPPLTTVSQNYFKMAAAAWRILLGQISVKQSFQASERSTGETTAFNAFVAGAVAMEEKVAVDLVVRASCGCLENVETFINEGLTLVNQNNMSVSEHFQTFNLDLLLQRLYGTIAYHEIQNFIIVHFPTPSPFTTFETYTLPLEAEVLFCVVGGKPCNEKMRFSTSDILPPEIKERMDKSPLILKPLYFSDSVFGYFVSSYKNISGHILSEIRLFLSDHIQGSLLLNAHVEMEQKLNDTLAELQAVNQRLSLLSHRDDLTGLLNRRGFFGESRKCFGCTSKDSHIIAYIDMDHLKTINDLYGHEEGDFAIRTVAQVLSESVREGDLVCRQSGDEFLLFIREAGKSVIPYMEKRFANNLRNANETLGKPYLIDFSWGFIPVTRFDDFDDCLRQADDRMMASKRKKKEVQKKEEHLEGS